MRRTFIFCLVSTVVGLCQATTAVGQFGGDMEMLPTAETIIPAETTIGEAPPIASSYPSWTQPSSFFARELWDMGIELGINGSEGNAQAFSMLAAGHFVYESDFGKMLMDITYGKSEANDVETQHFALFNSRYDRNINEKWFVYGQTRLEYDEFKDFDLRLTLTGGLGYHFIKNDITLLTGRFGAGTSREFGGSNEDWVAEANFGLDFEHQLSDRQRIGTVIDYYPEWSDFANYRLITDAWWELILDQQTNLSLKVGVIDRYDSTPEGREPNDIDYYVTLLWKL